MVRVTRSRTAQEAEARRLQAKSTRTFADSKGVQLVTLLRDPSAAAVVCAMLPGQDVVALTGTAVAAWALPGMSVWQMFNVRWQRDKLQPWQEGGWPTERKRQQQKRPSWNAWVTGRGDTGRWTGKLLQSGYMVSSGSKTYPLPTYFEQVAVDPNLSFMGEVADTHSGTSKFEVPTNWPAMKRNEPWDETTMKTVHLKRKMETVVEYSVRKPRLVNSLGLSQRLRRFPTLAQRFCVRDLRLKVTTYDLGKVCKLNQAMFESLRPLLTPSLLVLRIGAPETGSDGASRVTDLSPLVDCVNLRALTVYR